MTQPADIVAADIVATARRYLGVPWQHQGRSRLGLDCAGLAVLVARELHLSTFDIQGYGRRPQGDSLRRALQDAGCTPQPITLGALLLMRFGREPQHLAIVGDYPHGGLSLIHGLATSKAVVEHRLDDAWQRRIVSVWRFPGLSDPQEAA
jgi:cell wall-associated NlpC family hydrolase